MSRPLSANRGGRLSLARIIRDDSGAALIEMTVVIVLLLSVTFGIIEAALIAFQWNKAEKATHLGVRHAIQSDPVAVGFTTYSAVAEAGLNPADDVDLGVIPEFAITCTNSQCSLSDGALPSGFDATAHDATAFTAILTIVQSVFPKVTADKLAIEYRHVGFGFASRPGPDLIPNVTVSLQNMQYDVILMNNLPMGMADTLNMGAFAATMTGEDLCSTAPDVLGGCIPSPN